MEKIILENISIGQYAKMLRANNEPEKLKAIDAELSKCLGELAGGFDLALFMLQKDLLIFQCKFAVAYLDQDVKKMEVYNKKIAELTKEIERKSKVSEKQSPYKSFLAWVLSVEKYLGFSIDRENDLLYFSEATKQMLNYYEQQKKSYEESKVKKWQYRKW